MSHPDPSDSLSFRADEPHRRGDEAHLAEEVALARLERVLRMVRMLQSGQRYTSADLSKEFGVAKRTIFRDIRVLRDCGIPIDCSARGDGYYLEGDLFLRPAEPTASEVALLLLAIHSARSLPPPSGERLLEVGLSKLLGFSDRSLEQRLAQFDEMFEIVDVDAIGQMPDVPWMTTLIEHIVGGRGMRIWTPDARSQSLADRSAATTRRHVAPMRLAIAGGAWWLFCRSPAGQPLPPINLLDIALLEPASASKLRP